MKIKSYSLAICIQNMLIKKGDKTGFLNFNADFSSEELASIETLNITNCDSLDGLENLKNLKTLRLVGTNLENFSNTGALNNIVDFSPIKKIKQLENLAIWHDNNLNSLDLTGLENLVTLNLVSNQNLVEIKGLENLKNLKTVFITGSKVTEMGSPLKYIESTKDTYVNVLDVKMYEPLFSNEKVFKKLHDALVKNESSIRFGERIYFYDEIYTLSLEQMRELNRLAKNIINSLKLARKSNEEVVFEIYKYVVSNVLYDHEGLAYRDKNYENYLNAPKEKKEYFLRRMAFINSSLCALKEKKAVCDGYVNTIIYLLSLVNIKALPVVCMNKNGSLHSAIKILVDGNWIYADPEKDNGKEIRYYNLTREELAKMYELAPKEFLDYIDGGVYVKYFK